MDREVEAASGLERRAKGQSGNPPGQGPFLHVSLAVIGGVIQEATYETYQCPGCQACGRGITEMVTGKSVEEARRIRHEAVVERVGPLAKHRQICYALALVALNNALDQLEKA